MGLFSWFLGLDPGSRALVGMATRRKAGRRRKPVPLAQYRELQATKAEARRQLEAQRHEAKRQTTEARQEKTQHRREQGQEAMAKRMDRIHELIGRADRSKAEDAELSRLMSRNPSRFVVMVNPLRFGALTLLRNGRGNAREQSERFHGEPGEVLCLHGRQHVVLGRAESITYAPPGRSQRGNAVYVHDFGDQGTGKPKLRGRPLLVADAKTGQVELAGGPAKFSPEEGIVG